MIGKGLGLKAAAWLATLLLLGGCACCCGNPFGDVGPDPELVRADIIGAWTSDDGAKATFNEDGTFSASNLDVCIDDDPRPDDGSGTWVLAEGVMLYPYQQVELSFGKPSHFEDVWQADQDELSVASCTFTRD